MMHVNNYFFLLNKGLECSSNRRDAELFVCRIKGGWIVVELCWISVAQDNYSINQQFINHSIGSSFSIHNSGKVCTESRHSTLHTLAKQYS